MPQSYTVDTPELPSDIGGPKSNTELVSFDGDTCSGAKEKAKLQAERTPALKDYVVRADRVALPGLPGANHLISAFSHMPQNGTQLPMWLRRLPPLALAL